MDEVVYVVRQFNCANECLAIYGVYKSEEAANADLTANIPGIEFNPRRWVWNDRTSQFFYRVDSYTLR